MSNDHRSSLLTMLEPPPSADHAVHHEPQAGSLSARALSLAVHEGEIREGIELCKKAISLAPGDSSHYYHLGKIYMLAGQKPMALHTFRRGLKHGYHSGMVRELRRLGFRRPTIFPFLGRKHPLNRFTGLVLSRLGMQ